jgi:hypothetical protein
LSIVAVAALVLVAAPVSSASSSHADSSSLLQDEFCTKANAGGGAKPQTTVLGHYPEYKTFGPSSANRFNVQDAASLTDRQLWTLNKRFLDDGIARGDDFLLSTGPDMMRQKSFFAQELAYMQTRGYTPVQTVDGWRLVGRT